MWKAWNLMHNPNLKETPYLDQCEDFARVLLSAASFMQDGHSYEELYQHGMNQSQNPRMRQLWEEMVSASREKKRSPLDVLENQDAVLTPWISKIFVAGVWAGAEGIWVKGAQPLLDAIKTLREKSPLTTNQKAQLQDTLIAAGINAGLNKNLSEATAHQFLEKGAMELRD